MVENAQNNWRTDALQDSLDQGDGKKDKKVYGSHLTDLFIVRVDKIQEKLLKAKIPDAKKRMIEEGLWEQLEMFTKNWQLLSVAAPVLGFKTFLDDVNYIIGSNEGMKDVDGTTFTREQVNSWTVMTGDYLKSSIDYYLNRNDLAEEGSSPKEKINEHLIVGLSYPKDAKKIRAIFENLVVEWSLEKPVPPTKKEVEFAKLKKIDAHAIYTKKVKDYPKQVMEYPNRIYLGDAHPFHLVFIARSMGVPLDFEFTVSSLRKGEDGKRKERQKMTLGELIEYEKQHLLVNIPVNDVGHYDLLKSLHHEAEWLLMLLNKDGKKKENDTVGTNLLGEKVTYGDVVKCVKDEALNITQGHSWGSDDPWGLAGAILNPRGKYLKHINKNTPRKFTQSHLTCSGIHAADAILGSGTLSKLEEREVIDQAFARIYEKFLDSAISNGGISAKLSIFGHGLELYQQHGKKFRPEQKRFFEHMMKDLPKFMEELAQAIGAKKIGPSLGPEMSHFHEVLNGFKF